MTDTENYDKIKAELSKDFSSKEDIDKLVKATKDVTVDQIVNHKDCGNSECSVCSMKSNIDGTAFKRGALKGIQLGQKFPKVKFVGD